MAHITLVRPSTVLSKWAFSGGTCPPLGLAYVASSLRAVGHTVSVVDGVAEAILRYEPLRGDLLQHGLSNREVVERIPKNTDAIGFSMMFSHEFPVSRHLVGLTRESFPNAFLFSGGEHPTVQPQETLELCPQLDAVVLGEGEETVVELMSGKQDWRSPENTVGIGFRKGQGEIQISPRRPRIAHIDDISLPAWDLFNLTPYFRHGLGAGINRGRCIPVLASRGCPYECTFCSSPVMWTRKWSARDPRRVLDEIIGYVNRFDIQNVEFFDLTAVLEKRWLIEFCRLVLSSGCRFTWQIPSGTRSEALDEEVIDLMMRSGCRNITYAPENGSPAIIQSMKKRVDLEKMTRSMRVAVKRGLSVRANIIMGIPGETHRDVWQTLKFVVKLAFIGVHDTYLAAFSPYPGSEIHDQLKRAGRIPKPDDDYYFSLFSIQRFWDSASWSEHISPHMLVVYRLSGTGLFFLLSFLFRPLRFLKFFINLLRNRGELRLEKSLLDMRRRFRHSTVDGPVRG